MPAPFSKRLAATEWPADLQEAWAVACRPGTVLRQNGLAASWSHPTKAHVSGSLGNFLFWLRHTGQDTPGTAFADLATPERVAAYATARRAEIRDISVRSRLVGLVRGLAVLYPHREWSWIRRIIANIPDGQAESRQRKQPRVRHSHELFELDVKLTQRAEAETARRPIDRAVLFRDGLIIALLAVRPIRRKNLAALLIGFHLTKTATGWRLFLPAAEVKNREEYDKVIPPEVGLLLDRYLAVYQPILLAAGSRHAVADAHVWISSTGKPMAPDRIWQQVSARTRREFGRSVPPHFFRDSAMTTWALDLPKQVRGGIHVLGNRSFSVAQSAYNMAGSNIAAVKLQGVVASIRKASKRTSKLRGCATLPAHQKR